MRRVIGWGLGLLTMCAGVFGCGPGGVAQTIRPDDPTASDALGEKKGECHDVAGGGEPLIVDWKPDERTDLEVAMKDGVVVVAYSCEGIRLLPECKLEGGYGFVAVTRKEQVVRLKDADEVRANLPLSGAKLGAEMARGASLDVAVVTVGKKRTTWSEPTTADLQGKCDGATHYIRGANVGAFAMSTGTSAKVRAVAEMFGAGTEGQSTSDRQTSNKEGDLSACKSAKSDSDAPPDQCGAAIRLTLMPIAVAKKGEPPPEPAPKKAAVLEAPTCPAGLVYSEGKCAPPANVATYQCKPRDAAECEAQCSKGHAGSCGTFGAMLALGEGVAKDAAKAVPLLDKACSADDASACGRLGALHARGEGTARDLVKARSLFDKACAAGVADACADLGALLRDGGDGVTADAAAAQTALRQGCDAGSAKACHDAAVMVAAGKSPDDAREAMKLHRRACDGGQVQSCVAVGNAYESGSDGMPKVPMLAEHAYRRACFAGDPDGCFHYARLSYGTQSTMAKTFFQRACMRQQKYACASLALVYGENRPVVMNMAERQTLMPACNTGSNRACVQLGLLDASMKSPMAKNSFQKACRAGDKFACEAEAKVK